MSEPDGGRHAAINTLIATMAALGSVIGASAAAGYHAVVRTQPQSGWRDLLGPLGSISMFVSLAVVVLGLIVVATGERRPSRLGLAAAGVGLALLALAYWAWIIEGILDTT